MGRYLERPLNLERKHAWAPTAGLFAGLTILYLSTPSANELVDGLALGLRLADPGAVDPHPHHLLAELPPRALWLLASLVGWPKTVLATLHVFCALAAALFGVGVARLATALGAEAGQALAAGALAGLVRGPWLLGSTPDPFTLGAAVALFALADMVHAREGRCTPYRSALLVVLAALLHQSQAILLAPLLASVPTSCRHPWRERLGLALASVAPLFLVYFTVPIAHGLAPSDWPTWAAGYTASERWWSFEPWLVPVNMARMAAPSLGAPWIPWTIATLFVAAVLAWSAARSTAHDMGARASAPALWALACYFVFSSLWATSDPLFTIPIVGVVIAFLGRGLPSEGRGRLAPWIAVSVLLAVGLFGERTLARGPAAGGRELRYGLVEAAMVEASEDEAIVLLTPTRPAVWKVAIAEALSTPHPVYVMYEGPRGRRAAPRLGPPSPPWYVVHVEEAIRNRR